MTLSEWATESCTSRAIRARSSTTAACAEISRWASSWAAREAISRVRACSLRTRVPVHHAGTKIAGKKMESQLIPARTTSVTTNVRMHAATASPERRGVAA